VRQHDPSVGAHDLLGLCHLYSLEVVQFEPRPLGWKSSLPSLTERKKQMSEPVY
jgi:hypothetical protein